MNLLPPPPAKGQIMLLLFFYKNRFGMAHGGWYAMKTEKPKLIKPIIVVVVVVRIRSDFGIKKQFSVVIIGLNAELQPFSPQK